VLGASLVMIRQDAKLTRADMIAGLAFAAIMLGALTGLVLSMHSRHAFHRVHAFPGRLAQRVPMLMRRPDPGSPSLAPHANHVEADGLFDALQALVRRPRATATAFGHAFGAEALGALLLWSVLRALGEHPAWSLPLVAYAVSVLFGVVGFLPGGVGFVEAGLGAVLVSYGVAAPVAAAAVVLYRLFQLWVPVAVGAWAAQSLARSPSIA